jgi:hypothetical protein
VARQVFTGVGDNNGRLNNSVLQSAYTVYSQRKEEENPPPRRTGHAHFVADSTYTRVVQILFKSSAY